MLCTMCERRPAQPNDELCTKCLTGLAKLHDDLAADPRYLFD